MASIAAGKRIGVAPNADLYLLKPKGLYNTGAVGDKDRDYGYTAQAIDAVLTEIRLDILQRTANDPECKSVINISFGKKFFFLSI